VLQRSRRSSQPAAAYHYPGGVTDDQPARDDLTAAIGARRELGKDYEDAVVDSFIARMDERIAERVDEQVAERIGGKPRRKAPAPTQVAETKDNSSLVVSLVSLGAGIPITALSSETAGVAGLLVSWAGIAAVNVAHALSRRRSG
jgi:hypothetical protein